MLHGLVVLVVDDDDAPRALFRDVLALAGARVTAVASARAALTAIERDVPDVLVSDIMMPGEDGYWLISAIRTQQAGGRRIPAIALTGNSAQHSRDRVLRAGYDAHLAKPIDVDTLCAAVRRLAPVTSA